MIPLRRGVAGVSRDWGDRDGIDITDRPLAGVGTVNATAFAEDWPLCCGFQPSPVIAEAV
jgi:hypothetical protein